MATLTNGPGTGQGQGTTPPSGQTPPGQEPPSEPAPPAPEPDADADGSLNQKAKELPWVKAMAAENKKLRDAQEKAAADKKKAEQDAAIKAAEDAKNFDEAMRLKDEQAKEEISKLRKSTVATALKYAGYTEEQIETFAAAYSPDVEISDYVDSIAKKFPIKPATAPKVQPPGPVVTGPLTGSLSNEQIRALMKSADPKERAKGLDYLDAYWDEHKRLPEGYVRGK